jgi:hypothetical protein
MDTETSLELIAGILTRHNVIFGLSEDRQCYRLPFETSAVFLSAQPFTTDEVLVSISSPILSGIDLAGPGGAKAMNIVPSLNAAHRLFKFVLDSDGDLIVGYEMFGSGLRAEPLITVIHLMARAAERLGEQLADDLGGQFYARMIESAASREHDDVVGE